MKKLLSLIIALLMAVSVLLCGCTPVFDKSPDEYEGVKWVTPDYSFRFNPSNDCKGNFNYKETKYNIQATFDGSRITVTDTDKNQELFNGDWTYEDGDYLYVYNISYNTSAYEELKHNFSEFFRLNQEAL